MIMKKIEFERNGVTFIFNCETAYGRSGFNHHCNLWAYSPLKKLSSATCHYVNRTWEGYIYQTVCLKALEAVTEEVVKAELAVYKEANGYKVMSAKRMSAFKQWLQGSNHVNWLGYEVGKLYTALIKARESVSHGQLGKYELT